MSDTKPRHFVKQFQIRTAEGVRDIPIYSEEGFRLLTEMWIRSGWERKISYEATWLGIPIIQLPQDLLMLQEVVFKSRPDVIVETGTAHGGTAVFFASLLELLGKGQVISVDVEIRKHNRLAIQAHSLSKRIRLIEGSSIDDKTVAEVRSGIPTDSKVMVVLDSNHTYAHVCEELKKYYDLVTPGCYLVVCDGIMEILADAPKGSAVWVEDNPARAIREFLLSHSEFELDSYYNRLGITYFPEGFLRRKTL